jgi:hypothetical protein
MPLPAGLRIGDPVNYVPGYFDVTVWNRGNYGPVAALVTWIDTDNNTVDLSVLPWGKPMVHRTGIVYYTDKAAGNNCFKLLADPLPALEDSNL